MREYQRWRAISTANDQLDHVYRFRKDVSMTKGTALYLLIMLSPFILMMILEWH